MVHDALVKGLLEWRLDATSKSEGATSKGIRRPPKAYEMRIVYKFEENEKIFIKELR